MGANDAFGFAAFQQRVGEDATLAARLRPITDRTAFVRASVAEGTVRGFRFTAAEVEAALDANRHGWMTHWLPMI